MNLKRLGEDVVYLGGMSCLIFGALIVADNTINKIFQRTYTKNDFLHKELKPTSFHCDEKELPPVALKVGQILSKEARQERS